MNRYTYDILGRVVTEDLDANGSTPARDVTQFRYDPNENRVQQTLPAGNIIRTQYDERDLVFTVTRGSGDPAASTTRYDYDRNRNLADTVDARGFMTTYHYDGFDRRTEMIDSVGGRTTSHYDPAGNVVSTSSFGQTGGPSPTNNSGAGNVLLNQRTAEYDELSRRFQYDERPINGSSFIASGVTTTRPPSITTGPLNPGSISTQTLYDRNSRVVQTTQDDLTTTATQYDGVNRRVMVTDPAGNTVQTMYDADNNVIQTNETDLSQKAGVANETFTTMYRYDSLNRRTSTSDNCQNTRRAAYDSRNNPTHMTDAKGDTATGCPGASNVQGNSMRYTYDGMSRRIQSVQDLRTGGIGSNPIDTTNTFNPSGQINIAYLYDANGRVTTVTDNNGNATRYTYDALDRRTVETLPDSTSMSWTYDGNDNVLTLTDNNGSVRTHTYDAIDRRIQTSIAPAAGVTGTTSTAYQYDGLSRVTRMTDNNDPADATSASTVTFAYDSLSRVIEETENGKAIDSAWTAQSRRTGLTYPNGRQLAYTYDSLERMQTIKDAGALTNLTQYTYIGQERVLQRQYQNGSQLTYLDNAGTTDIGYDALRRTVQSRDLRNDNSLIVGFAHAYDREDNKNFESKLHSPTNSELYTYDSVYRLTDFARGQLNGSGTGMVGAPSSTQDWTLDGVGNWRVNLINGISQTRAVNSTNEYTQLKSKGGPPDNESYDSNGNLIMSSGQDLAFQWDYKNRLRKVCALAGGATQCADAKAKTLAVYSYDAMDRRTRKVVTNSGALNGATSFYYDAYQAIEERDGTDTLTQQYVFGNYVDEPLVLDRASGPRLFYHQNTLSSTFALTDPAGAIVEGYQYDAYGQQTVFGSNFSSVIGVNSAVGNPYMYTGQRFDAESGLYYYKSRYYSPLLGRFLSRDTNRAVDINRYEYVSDRPTALFDPYGDKPKDCAKNTQPKRAVVFSGDVSSPYTRLAQALPQNSKGNFEDVSKRINSQLNGNCDCIKELVLQAHSNTHWFDLRGRRYKNRRDNVLEEFGDNKIEDGDDPKKFTRVTPDNAEKFIDVVRETARFCPTCSIWLLGCNVGLGDIPGKLAAASGCTVQAPKGYIEQVPVLSRTVGYNDLQPLEKKISKSMGDKFPEHPGAEAKFGVFPPPKK